MVFAFLVWNRVWSQIYGYRFSGSGLKRGMKNNIFWSEIGSGFWEPCDTPPPKILGISPPQSRHTSKPNFSNTKWAFVILSHPCNYETFVFIYYSAGQIFLLVHRFTQKRGSLVKAKCTFTITMVMATWNLKKRWLSKKIEPTMGEQWHQ